MLRRFVLALVLVVALAGCLGGVVDDGTDEPSTETTEEPTEIDDATESDEDDADGDETDDADDEDGSDGGADADASDGDDGTGGEGSDGDGADSDGEDGESDGANGGDADAAGLAPGVTTDGIEDPDALLDAHSTYLIENGFELTYSALYEYDELDDWRLTYDLAVEPAGEEGLATIGGLYEGGEYVTWGNETRTVSKVTTDEGTQYDVADEGLAGEDPAALTLVTEFRELFEDGEFAVESTDERDGRTYATLVATEFEETDGEAEVVVDDRGVVHGITANETDSSGTTTLEYEVAAVGGVAVDRPAWVDDVPDAAELDVSLSFETYADEHHTLTNNGEDAVPAGSTIEVVVDEEETATLELEEPLHSGEQVFLYATEEGYVLTREEVDEADRIESDANSASITVVSDEGTVLYQVSVGWGSDSATDGSDG